MLAASFIQMNPMWIKMGAKYEEVFSVIRGRMIVCCRGQNSFVYLVHLCRCWLILTVIALLVSAITSIWLIILLQRRCRIIRSFLKFWASTRENLKISIFSNWKKQRRKVNTFTHMVAQSIPQLHPKATLENSGQ